MPFTDLRKEHKDMSHLVYGKMKANRLTNSDMANRMGIHRNTFARKLNDMDFTVSELRILANSIRLDEKEIMQIIQYG